MQSLSSVIVQSLYSVVVRDVNNLGNKAVCKSLSNSRSLLGDDTCSTKDVNRQSLSSASDTRQYDVMRFERSTDCELVVPEMNNQTEGFEGELFLTNINIKQENVSTLFDRRETNESTVYAPQSSIKVENVCPMREYEHGGLEGIVNITSRVEFLHAPKKSFSQSLADQK